MSVAEKIENIKFDFTDREELAGFRLHRLEVYNWGTFNRKVWALQLGGENALLTGDIGSGKSTLVDAVTTLMVPPQRITYNKAAGADTKERTLRTYVLGYYKSGRSESGAPAKQVALRDQHNYSVILGSFHNEGFKLDVTLAQVFWNKESQGQPARFYVVADRLLSLAADFAGFGSNVNDLKKRLRSLPGVALFDNFPPYAAEFRRRFGIKDEQALELFNQTVSMKSVGNLTDFVREHMLEAFAIEARIEALIDHFNDLNRAHEAVLKAKDQVARLTPLVTDCTLHGELLGKIEIWRSCREALKPYFSSLKAELIEKRLASLAEEGERLGTRIRRLSQTLGEQREAHDQIKGAIAQNGGDRIAQITNEINMKQQEKANRQRRAERYAQLARELGLLTTVNGDNFSHNHHQLAQLRETCQERRAELDNLQTEAGVDLRELNHEHAEIEKELASLRQRRSNIPGTQISIRSALCKALDLPEETMPFTGELLQVNAGDTPWEGVAERLLHNFALSLLVPDRHYAAVVAWVDRTQLKDRRLVYFRVREGAGVTQSTLSPASLVRKITIKPNSSFYGWLENELSRRFDYACCETIEQFRRERQALTPMGQIKGGGERHEKDDRHRLDDRSRYCLGWSNEGKINVLEQQKKELQGRIQVLGDKINTAKGEQRTLGNRLQALAQISEYSDFSDLDWQPLAVAISDLQGEKRALETASDVLQTLTGQLAELKGKLAKTEEDLDKRKSELAANQVRREQAHLQLTECQESVAAYDSGERATRFAQLEALRAEAPGQSGILTVESCEGRERDLHRWLQVKIDAENDKLNALGKKIVLAMGAYCAAYPLETREIDPSLDAAAEYRSILGKLQADDLPRFEKRFKELLNENTIREVANFQSQLAKERESIRERIDRINTSLAQIDYNPGRYILLEPQPTTDREILDFQGELRACTEGTLTGSGEDQYSEAKFLQVKSFIERFRGREGRADQDLRWRRKVTDVRNWFTFSASERWREDDKEHEHYTDAGGKSGGQKEKLAYTILAASLAYQFGLEWGAVKSRSFRFAVIDEAFGRGSDESAHFGLELFKHLNLQLLVVTPLQKIHIIEPYVASVGFVHNNEDGSDSQLRNLTITEYRAEREARKL